MKKIDDTVRKETIYISVWVILLSAVMQAVFLIIDQWDYTVLLGNILGGIVAILNFFFMGLTIQNAVQKEEKEAKNTMKASQSLRMLAIFIAVVLGAVLPCCNIWAAVLPLFFPRIAVALRPLCDKKHSAEEVNTK